MAGPIASNRIGGSSKPPMVPETASLDGGDLDERRDTRSDGRDEFVRVRPREPHRRFEIDKRQMRKDMDYCWAAAKVMGQPNPLFIERLQMGWKPVKGADHPELAGLNVEIDPRLIELGLVPEKRPGDPIEDRGQMLMMRPKHLSQQSREEDQQRATEQYTGHMHRITNSSRRAIGDKTQYSHRRTNGAQPSADMIPDDADLEE